LQLEAKDCTDGTAVFGSVWWISPVLCCHCGAQLRHRCHFKATSDYQSRW